MIIEFIKSLFSKKKEIVPLLQIPPKETNKILLPAAQVKEKITKPQDRIGKFICDVCAQEAQHIALINEKIVIGAKCNKCMDLVMDSNQEGPDLMLQGQFKTNVHWVGFYDQPYNRWLECTCPKSRSHFSEVISQ